MNKIFIIEGMSCKHCVQRVKNVISELSGVQEAEVSLKANSASVEFDENVLDVITITSAIEDAGYSVK